MVIWDTNILARYFGKRLDQEDQLRMTGLVEELRLKREPIGIPAQVWAEFLEAASDEEIESSTRLFNTTAFRLLPYDGKAALETVHVARNGSSARKSLKEKKRERQAVKVDWQIIAVALANNARLLLSDDIPFQKEAVRSGVDCKGISDLDIPDKLKQQSINYNAPIDSE